MPVSGKVIPIDAARRQVSSMPKPKNWRDDLQGTGEGNDRRYDFNFLNASLILENDTLLPMRFKWNEFTGAAEAHPVNVGKLQSVTDSHIRGAMKHLQKAGLRFIAKGAVDDAIKDVAEQHPYNPVRDQLNALVWDGKDRLSTWLSVYLGTPNDEYHQAIGRYTLLGLVARMFNPGCKMDYSPVLCGGQGASKSSVCLNDGRPRIFQRFPTSHQDRWW